MIVENLKKVIASLPSTVDLVVATKDRSIEEIQQALCGGARIIGENYVKEAQAKFEVIGRKVKWHFIGHLQKNKAKYAVKIFDLIETLDSLELAKVLDQECKKIDKIMPVLIEVNCAAEPQKYGLLIEEVENFLPEILPLSNLKPMGLMTMGPWLDNSERLRPYFRKTKELFDKIEASYAGCLEWKYLSMGMSASYQIAVEEGANIVRIGTAIFGEGRS